MAQEHRVAEDATVIVTTPNFSVNRSARTASLFGSLPRFARRRPVMLGSCGN